MRIPSHHFDDERRHDLAMTPMIDVVFLLLIFFVCASIGQIREWLLPTELSAGTIQTPEAPEQEPEPEEEIWLELEHAEQATTVKVLHVARLGASARRTEVKQLPLGTGGALGELRRIVSGLAETSPDLPVVLDIGPTVPMRDVIQVYDTCYAVGLRRIHFATEPPSPAGG